MHDYTGQHEQSLWGLLGGIPGLSVVVPSTPEDAAGLTVTALSHDGPTIVVEHKLLSKLWLPGYLACLLEPIGSTGDRVSRETLPLLSRGEPLTYCLGVNP